MAAGQMLIALDFHLGPVQEFAVVGDNPEQVLAVLRQGFRPRKVVAWKGSQTRAATIPLLEGKTSQGGVTTYICQDFTCQAPVVGVEALRRELEEMLHVAIPSGL